MKTTKEHNKKWPYIPDHAYIILIIGGPGSEKTNALLNLIKEQDHIDKIYLYAKDLIERKNEFLIKKPEDAGTKHFRIQMRLFSVQILSMTLMRILTITTQTEKEKF